MKEIKYCSYDWVGDIENSCSCLEYLLKKLKEDIKNNESHIIIKEKIDNIRRIINEIEDLSYSEIENNIFFCLDILVHLGIISCLNANNDDLCFSIIGLENNIDKRCNGFKLIDCRFLQKNHICFSCKKIKIEGVMDNSEYDKRIDKILQTKIKNNNISWKIISSYLYNTKNSTIAELEITFCLKL